MMTRPPVKWLFIEGERVLHGATVLIHRWFGDRSASIVESGLRAKRDLDQSVYAVAADTRRHRLCLGWTSPSGPAVSVELVRSVAMFVQRCRLSSSQWACVSGTPVSAAGSDS